MMADLSEPKGGLTPTMLEYLEWRSDPTREGSKEKFATDHHVSRSTLAAWERKPWFKEGLERRLAELNVSPDRIQTVLETLWREAKDGDVQAARQYLAAVEDMRPKRTRIEDTSVADLSDEELDAAWADGIAALKNGRVLG